jgi:hypothetical protein
MTDDVPDGVTELEYGRFILENILGWPAKNNLEMMADCLRSIGKSRRLTPVQSHKYMVRAIKLAKEQGIPVNHYFFTEGKYTEVRPQKENTALPLYKRIDRKALDREQSTPEWQAANAELRAVFAKWAGKSAMRG